MNKVMRRTVLSRKGWLGMTSAGGGKDSVEAECVVEERKIAGSKGRGDCAGRAFEP
jgi:hypothetical protein